MRSREVQGTPFSHPVPAGRATGRGQPLLERAAGEAASPQQNDLGGVRVHIQRAGDRGQRRRTQKL